MISQELANRLLALLKKDDPYRCVDIINDTIKILGRYSYEAQPEHTIRISNKQDKIVFVLFSTKNTPGTIAIMPGVVADFTGDYWRNVCRKP